MCFWKTAVHFGKPITRIQGSGPDLVHALLPLLVGKGPKGELVVDLTEGFTTIILLPGGQKLRITAELVDVDLEEEPIKPKPKKKPKRKRKKKELDFDI